MPLIRVPKSPYWYYRLKHNGKVYVKSTQTRNRVKASRIESIAREELLDKLFSMALMRNSRKSQYRPGQ